MSLTKMVETLAAEGMVAMRKPLTFGKLHQLREEESILQATLYLINRTASEREIERELRAFYHASLNELGRVQAEIAELEPAP